VVALLAVAFTLAFAALPGTTDGASAQQGTPERPAATTLRPINIGFLRHAIGSWMAHVADGSIDTATGRTIRWLPCDTDSTLVVAMSAGRVDVGLIGAGVAAAAIVRGLDLRIFYVMGAAPDSDALMVGPGIEERDPRGLSDKVIAVPFGSTSHFRLLESLKHLGATLPTLRIVNLQTSQIKDAWYRAEIDAAAGSGPLLAALSLRGRRMPLSSTGPHTGLLVLSAPAEFTGQHVVFLSRLVDVVARAQSAAADPDWPRSAEDPGVLAIARVTGLPPKTVASRLGRYRPPALTNQLSSEWLGGGSASGLVAHLEQTLDVWRWAGRLPAREPGLVAAITLAPAQMALSYQAPKK
jgi:taurine transport system substrate-binding protein